MKLVRSLLALGLGALGLACEPAASDPTTGRSTLALGIRPQTKLWTGDAEEYAEFGQTVALDEDAMLVGAPFESITEEQSGAAHLFERQDGQWQERPRVVASPASGRSRFGRAAVLSESEVVVGADWDDSTGGTDSGAVYVYSRADLQLSQKLEPTALDGRFGSRLARHGDQLLVGAPYEEAGAAYLFERGASGWEPGPRLAPLAEAGHYYFGRVLGLSNTVAAVGAEAETYELVIFEREGSDWQQVETLIEPDGGLWGNSVVVDEQQVLVGDPEGGPRGWGAVHVFERELSYAQVATLTSDVPSPGFGGSLALEAGRLIVGCQGAAVVFERTGQQWHEVEALLPQDANRIAGLTSVALWGDDIALGAPRASALNLAEPGAVFLFAHCSSDSDCPAPDHCEGDGACHPPKANAATCQRATECDSGFCVDGVCCNAACQGSCEACSETEQVGRCMAISGQPRGEREPCGSHELCGGSCDGISRACSYAPRRTPCGSRCVDEGELVSSCDGNGRCVEEAPSSCGDYACRDRACRGFCEGDDDCSGAAICVSATCVTLVAPTCSEDGSESLTEGEARQCGAYRCDPSSGACATACASSAQCASGFVCDDATRNCVELDTSDSIPSSSGCGCRVPARTPARHGSWLLLLGSALLAWRRRLAISSKLLLILGAMQLGCAPGQSAPERELGRRRAALAPDAIWSDGQILSGETNFGRSLAASDNTLLVGGPNAAELFVYEKGRWQALQVVELAPADGGQCFGDSVALFGDTALLGSVNGARLLERAGPGQPFVELSRLEPSGVTSQYSGCSVQLHEHHATLSSGSESALFTRTEQGWQQTDMLPGMAIALDANRLVVQSPYAVGEVPEARVYQHSRAGATLELTLPSASGETYDDFGHVAVLGGDTLVVGSYGLAYAYDLMDSSAPPQKLGPPDGGTREYFGSSLALVDDVLLVGDPQALQVDGPQVHVFRGERQNWQRTMSRLGPGDLSETSGNYGIAVAIGADELLVGADDLALGNRGPFGAVISYGRCVHDASCPEQHFCGGDQFCHPVRELGDLCSPVAGHDCHEDGCAVCGALPCVDGVCCEDACTGQCQACAEPGRRGQCVLIEGEPRSEREPCAGTGSLCGGSCTGEEQSCQYPTSAESCDSSCDQGRERPATCDGRGECVSRNERPCLGYQCGKDSCLTSCASDRDCTAGFVCKGQACVASGHRYECAEDGASSSAEDGEQVQCGAYLCDPQSGECRTECTATSDCRDGLVCDVEHKVCVEERARGSDAGCACRSAPSGDRATWAAVLLVLCWRGRRRMAPALRSPPPELRR